ncbi:hypothetical protein CEXT_686731, partial [Caerostris extrusa]
MSEIFTFGIRTGERAGATLRYGVDHSRGSTATFSTASREFEALARRPFTK